MSAALHADNLQICAGAASARRRLRGVFAATMNFAASMALAIVAVEGRLHRRITKWVRFSVFMSYAQGMMEPVRWIIDAISDLITTQVNIERVSTLLAVQSDVTDTPEVIAKYGDILEPKKENWEPLRGDIEFKRRDLPLSRTATKTCWSTST